MHRQECLGHAIRGVDMTVCLRVKPRSLREILRVVFMVLVIIRTRPVAARWKVKGVGAACLDLVVGRSLRATEWLGFPGFSGTSDKLSDRVEDTGLRKTAWTTALADDYQQDVSRHQIEPFATLIEKHGQQLQALDTGSRRVRWEGIYSEVG